MTHLTRSAIFLVITILLSGCTTIQHDASMPSDVAAQGLRLKRALPANMPEGSVPATGGQLVLVPTENLAANVADLVMPIPFITDIAAGAYKKYQASGLGKHYGALDIFDIVQRAMADSPLLMQGRGQVIMYPIVYLAECTDGQYRLSLTGRIEQAPWIGRYVVHVPVTYDEQKFSSATPAMVDSMRHELEAAAIVLRQIIESDAGGKFNTVKYKADLGSLHLSCAKLAGLVSSKLMLARNAEVVDEGDDHVVVRIDGDVSQSGSDGGLMYGLHYLRRDQLHTFVKMK